MQLNGSIIRGALKLSCASPSITAAVHTMIKPLLITTTNATFSNDITVTNIIHSNKVTNTYLAGNQGNAIISSDVNTGGSYVMLDRLKSTNGVFTDGVYNGGRMFYYTDNSVISAGDNITTYSLTLLDENGDTTLSKSLTIPGNLTVKGWASITGAITGASTLAIAGAITGKSTLAITGAITGKSTLTIDGKITGKNSASITGTITATSDIYSSGGKIYTPKAAMNNDGSISGTNLTLSGNASVSGWIYAKDTIGIWDGSAWLASMGNTGNISGANVTVSGTTKTNTLVLTANYGTGDPSGGVNGQVYFKII